MSRAKRHAQILVLLEGRAGLSAGELARHFGVSRMTIHRDLDALARRGRLQRIRGGAVTRRSDDSAGLTLCSGCGREPLPHQGCVLRQKAAAEKVYCCVTCGLRHASQAEPSDFWVRDQISGRQLPAMEAFYLINSLVAPCCQPAILSFAREEEADMFQDGFGGTPARLDDALEFLRVAAGLGD